RRTLRGVNDVLADEGHHRPDGWRTLVENFPLDGVQLAGLAARTAGERAGCYGGQKGTSSHGCHLRMEVPDDVETRGLRTFRSRAPPDDLRRKLPGRVRVPRPPRAAGGSRTQLRTTGGRGLVGACRRRHRSQAGPTTIPRVKDRATAARGRCRWRDAE